MANHEEIAKFIADCRQSATFFMENSCRIKHPLIGIIPFKLFGYQRQSLFSLRKNRFNIFKKCRQCLAEGSPVQAPGGDIPIENVRAGDTVFTLNRKSESIELATVEQLHDNGVAQCYQITMASRRKIILTMDHRILTYEGMKEVAELRVGDHLVELNAHTTSRIAEIAAVGQRRVYDLTIPPHHNYIVNDLIVHNCGISTLTGIYALWVAMFFGNKKILIVSKRDLDAKSFLDDNIKLVYNNLPAWMREIWKTPILNEHELGFQNGSIIRSLTSSPDTLRSNASSLNIIDEAAFMPDMETMWSGGWSTLQHGGSAVIISTPNGQGNWYWDKWTDAEDKTGIFNPLLINWWDMDWVIQSKDQISGNTIRIAPTDGIRKCTTPAERDKWGPYWSPWLENEYKGLQARGEAHLFKQEILGQFIGGGGTIITTMALENVGKTVEASEDPQTVAEPISWTNQGTGTTEYIDFSPNEPREGLWIWKKPDAGKPTKYHNGRVIDPGEPGHAYVAGVDTATGENNDYHAIEVYDTSTMEQVAEYMGRVPIAQFAKMVDWIGRWYNDALVNPERTGVGAALVQELRGMLYPNLWRMKRSRLIRPGVHSPTGPGISLGPEGFSTTPASKPALNKALIEFIGEKEDEGYAIRSPRLYKQLQIYIRHKNRQGIETKRTGAQTGRGNFDDLVIATALAFIAAPDVIDINPIGLIPTHSKQVGTSPIPTRPDMSTVTDQRVLMPLTYSSISRNAPTVAEQVDAFARQLVAGQSQVLPASRQPKKFYR